MKNNQIELTKYESILIFGVGLIGGSVALSLKKKKLVKLITGVGRSSLKIANELGIIDQAAENEQSLIHAISNAEVICLATPVGQMPEIFAKIAAHLSANTLIIDGGSTKNDVISAAYQFLGDKVKQFVPCHPIAGAENSGPQAATDNLYLGKKIVITPLPENSPEMIDRAKQFWLDCDGEVHFLAPQKHDQIFAAVSHLPHLLSFALVHDLAIREDSEQYFKYAASGFRDFTRIAASHPEMWRDICLANRQSLIEETQRYIEVLKNLEKLLEKNNGEQLINIFGIARKARKDWGEQHATDK